MIEEQYFIVTRTYGRFDTDSQQSWALRRQSWVKMPIVADGPFCRVWFAVASREEHASVQVFTEAWASQDLRPRYTRALQLPAGSSMQMPTSVMRWADTTYVCESREAPATTPEWSMHSAFKTSLT